MLRTMIDTLRFADRLKDSGFESCQAEGMARALGDALAGTVENLATKSDLDALDTKLSTRIGALDTQIKFVLATLAMLLALGLVDTVPRLLG